MDSVTQAALGAGVTALCVPAGHRRKALLAGAMLGTLPDLDVFIDYGDAVANFTYHRSVSHSLFVLVPGAIGVWALLRRLWAPVRMAPGAWLLAIMLALVTHPLLDAHTAYGTQLFWPIESIPVAWATLFIIDPAFTSPLVVGAVLSAIRPARSWSRKALIVGMTLSCLYLSWSWVAKTVVERDAHYSLAAEGQAGAAVFSVPTPFNTLLWRVVAMTDDGYREGFRSLLYGRSSLSFTRHPSDMAAMRAADDIWAVRRLGWFANGFVSAEVVNDVLVVSDLRMGQEPKYVFRYAVAHRDSAGWHEIPTESHGAVLTRDDVGRVLDRLHPP